VRGLRVTFDFEVEYQMALTNRQLAPEIEFVCLMTRQAYAFLSSSIVKEIALLRGDVSGMVPPHVADALEAKRRERDKNHEPAPVVSIRD
jgi:pantetheine-phosphate adenylyltransferase